MKARALINLNRDNDAVEALNRAIAYDPSYVEAHYYKGRLLDIQRRPKEALKEYDEALRLDPNSTDTLISKAKVLGALGRDADVIAVANRIIELLPNATNGYRIKALALHLLPVARNQEALQTIDIALRVDPNDVESLTMKSAILDDIGRYSEARSLLHRVLEIDPTNELATVGLEEMNRNNHW